MRNFIHRSFHRFRKLVPSQTCRRLALALALTWWCSSGCTTGFRETADAAGVEGGCIEQFDPSRDYFPKKIRPEAASNFSVEYHLSYKVVTVHEASQGGGPETYVLLQCGAPKPEVRGELSSAPVIRVPIRSLFSESTTHEQPLVDLGRVDVLTGIAGAQYTQDESIRARLRAGRIIDFAPSGMVNVERVIASAPSILMSSRNNDAAFAPIRNAGVPVVVNAEWLEQSALGRAEWIKFIALFLNEEARADQRFAEIRDSYRLWASRTAGIPAESRPRVTTGGVFRGRYIIAGGRSYVAGLIEDAGGNYVWSDDKQTGAPSVDIEAGIARAAGADYWINGASWTSLQAMLSDEPRYREFKAFRTGQVWLYNLHLNSDGTNEYWSRGVSRPETILADLIKIFHPELARDHEFAWYARVRDLSR